MGLEVVVVRAQNLLTHDKMGKGDPYFEIKYGGHDWSTDKKKGANPEWSRENHEFHSMSKHNELYVLHKDKDLGADNVIAACAINLSQLDSVTNGWFTLFDKHEQPAGRVLLNIGKDGNVRDLPAEREYPSLLNEELKKMVKNSNIKANVLDYGMAAGVAMGAGFMGKKKYDERQGQEQQNQ